MANHPRPNDPLKRFMKFVAVDPVTKCWNWIGAADEHGYGKFGYLGKTQTATRVSIELHRGPFDPALHALHSCDNPKCVNPEHLEAGTRVKNAQDAYERGLIGRGEKHPTAILTDAQVDDIRTSPRPGRHLAKELGVSPSTIYAIRGGRTRLKKALP